MLEGRNIICLDLEVLHSADDCKFCDRAPGDHGLTQAHVFSPIGWENKAALGLSIGCYYDYQCGEVVWFDRPTLLLTVHRLLQRQPLMVSFNGRSFDFSLMRGLLRRDAEQAEELSRFAMAVLCDQFKALATDSYDLLHEIWAVDAQSKFVKGLNSLDAIARANGLPGKTGDGAQAPRDWQAGKIAQVCNYCQHDVLLTKRLFELVVTHNGTLQRANGPLTLRVPVIEGGAY